MRLNVLLRKFARTHEGARGRPSADGRSSSCAARSCPACCGRTSSTRTARRSRTRIVASPRSGSRPKALAAIAIEAREVFHLRHAPLLLLEVLSRTGKGDPLVADTVVRVIQRADELGELVALHHKLGGKQHDPGADAQGSGARVRQVRRVRAREVRPRHRGQAARRAAAGAADAGGRRAVGAVAARQGPHAGTPDTWEVALSGGADKKEAFERLLRERKLGYLACCATCATWRRRASTRRWSARRSSPARAARSACYPFRYVAAARAAPQFEPYLDQALLAAIGEMPKLARQDHRAGRRVRLDGGEAVAQVRHEADRCGGCARRDRARGRPAAVHVLRRAGRGAASSRHGRCRCDRRSQPHNGTQLGAALSKLGKVAHDRLIVVTDEQSHDRSPRSGGEARLP